MATTDDLIGIWSADARFGSGAQSDEMLIFKPDGTGRAAVWNWQLLSVDFFRWQIVSPGLAILVGYRRLEFAEIGEDPIEVDGEFHHNSAPYSVVEEETPSGKRMRVLRIALSFPYPSEFGFRCRDLVVWEEPRF